MKVILEGAALSPPARITISGDVETWALLAMSGCSTPKRQLEPNEDDPRSEEGGFNPKRNKLKPPSTDLAGSRSSDVQMLVDASEQMNICSHEAVIECPRSNCRPPSSS